jgi:hypothetical protein
LIELDEQEAAFAEGMDMIVDGTRYHVSRLMKGYDGYVSHFNPSYSRAARARGVDRGVTC